MNQTNFGCLLDTDNRSCIAKNNPTPTTAKNSSNELSELEKCCAIGVHLLDTWGEFNDIFSNVRNNHGIFSATSATLQKFAISFG